MLLFISLIGELQKGETKCKPLKQTDKLDAKVHHKEEEESESSDSDSSDSDEPETSASAAATEAKEGAAQAPVELKGKVWNICEGRVATWQRKIRQ